MDTNHHKAPRYPRKLLNINLNHYQDVNNIEQRDIIANAVTHQSTPHPSFAIDPRIRNMPETQRAHSPSATASSTASEGARHTIGTVDAGEFDAAEAHQPEYTEEQQKFHYHYNLLLYMRHPQQHSRIAYDAQISAGSITAWCIFNMLFGFSTAPSLQLTPSSIGRAHPLSVDASILQIEQLYQRQELFSSLIVFLIAVLVIHKDIILCNAQLCLPMLLLFCLNVRFTLQYIIQFEASWDCINLLTCLLVLWFMCCRFFFNVFKSTPHDVHWNLCRCHFFYRGFYIRWVSFMIYAWFNSIMVLQLMDSVCLSDGQLRIQTKLCQMSRVKFIGCDMVIVVYCVMVLGIWSRLQFVNTEHARHQKLTVKNYGVFEIVVFIVVLVSCNLLCETYLSRLVVQKMLLPFTVVIILVTNFLMR